MCSSDLRHRCRHTLCISGGRSLISEEAVEPQESEPAEEAEDVAEASEPTEELNIEEADVEAGEESSESLGSATVDNDGERVSNVKLEENSDGTKLYLSYDYKAGYVYYIHVTNYSEDDGPVDVEGFDFFDDNICPVDSDGNRKAATSSGRSTIDITDEFISQIANEEGKSGDIYALIEAYEPGNTSQEDYTRESNIYHYDTSGVTGLYLLNVDYDSDTGVLSWEYPFDNPGDIYKSIDITIMVNMMSHPALPAIAARRYARRPYISLTS